MKRLTRLFFAAVLLALGPLAAQAAITCTSISSPGVSINYPNGGTASVQTYFTVSCTRGLTSDATSVSYGVKADNGLQPTGQNNNARLNLSGTNYDLRYDVYTTGCAAAQWKGNTTISDTITWSAGVTGTQTKNTTFWGCINTAATLTAAGTYTDTTTMSMTYNGVTITGTVPVAIYGPALCSVATPSPSTITLNYTAFGGAASSTANVNATCTATMPYTVSVSPASGTLAGVAYTVAVSPLSANGTGSAQPFTITVSAIAGQSGTCTGTSCSQTQASVVTVTY